MHQIKKYLHIYLSTFNHDLSYQPGKEDAFDHHKVLHENIPLCFLT